MILKDLMRHRRKFNFEQFKIFSTPQDLFKKKKLTWAMKIKKNLLLSIVLVGEYRDSYYGVS